MNIVIAAHCQSLALSQILKDLKGEEGNTIFDVIFDKPFYEINDDEKESFLGCLREADILLYQPHSSKQNSPDWRASQYWVENTTADHCISFDTIFFTGYNPELTYITKPSGQHLNEGFVDYHDKRIAKLYAEGKNPPQILSGFQAILPSEKDVKDNLQATFKAMRDRESELNLDIKLSGFIESNYQHERLFFTYNNPSNALLLEVVRQALVILDVNVTGRPEISKELLSYDEFPILPSVKEYLGLTFDGPQDRHQIQNKSHTVSDVVERYFEIYENNHQLIVEFVSQFKEDSWLARKKLIIHIGLSKTGTTSFQKKAYDNAADLERHGLLYPQSGVGTVNHLLVAQHFSGRSQSPELIKSLIEEMHVSSANIIMLSCEALEGLSVKNMKVIRESFQGFDIFILCTFRNRLSWLRSMYAEIIKKALCMNDFADFIAVNTREEGRAASGFLSGVLELFRRTGVESGATDVQHPAVKTFNIRARYGNKLKQWESVFLKQRLKVCNIESESIWHVIDDISGLELEKISGSYKDDKMNRSPSVLTIELLKRFYLQHDIHNLDYALASNFVKRVEKLLKDSGENIFYNSHFECREELKAYVEQSIDDDIVMLQNYGVNRSGFDGIANMNFIQPAVIDSLYQDYQPKLLSIFNKLSSQF